MLAKLVEEYWGRMLFAVLQRPKCRMQASWDRGDQGGKRAPHELVGIIVGIIEKRIAKIILYQCLT